jgi:hypothetical protein
MTEDRELALYALHARLPAAYALALEGEPA